MGELDFFVLFFFCYFWRIWMGKKKQSTVSIFPKWLWQRFVQPDIFILALYLHPSSVFYCERLENFFFFKWGQYHLRSEQPFSTKGPSVFYQFIPHFRKIILRSLLPHGWPEEGLCSRTSPPLHFNFIPVEHLLRSNEVLMLKTLVFVLHGLCIKCYLFFKKPLQFAHIEPWGVGMGRGVVDVILLSFVW